ncbi:MAG: flagellar basal-body rod protein FlgB [Nitrospira sp. OLB3]|nr:MAG: flagellar basal-body rod protein FlgB [Nitrospira sp. OLB3]
MKTFDRTMGLMQQVLNLRAAQHRVITANIANEETPGFRANELRFTDALTAARRSETVTVHVTDPRHVSVPSTAAQSFIQPVAAGDLPLDANTVNIDLEMAKLSDNAMRFNMTAELLARKFRGLLNAIHEGR